MKKALIPLFLSAMLLASCGGGASSEAQSSAPAADLQVTFDLGYEGAPAATKVGANIGKALSKPNDPLREGYTFLGWVNEKDGQIFDFEHLVVTETADYTLKAYWVESSKKGNTFEAEYCPCITDGQGMQGSTYSGGTLGAGLIGYDRTKLYNASNEYYVHFLYNKGCNLIFNINAEAAATGATLVLRLSAEYKSTFTINKDMWKVKLNDNQITYKPITFNYVSPQGADPWPPFTDYVISNIDLQQGVNKFELITDNEELLFGTAYSTAPMVDALKVYTESKLSWPEEKQENLDLV